MQYFTVEVLVGTTYRLEVRAETEQEAVKKVEEMPSEKIQKKGSNHGEFQTWAEVV